MLIGTRMVFPEEVGQWDADFLQISFYRNMDNNLNIMKDSVNACRDAGKRYVIHPVGYSVLDKSDFSTLAIIAELADLALILHDERDPDGERITGRHETLFKNAIEELGAITHLSFENAVNTRDVRWFWDKYADSVTVDIGHIEVAGLDSVEFIKSLDNATINKIEYTHMHRNNGLHGGITDHWPLRRDCTELKALEELAGRKSDIHVLLELNETDEIGESLNILKEFRDRLQA
jgi:sugar phosphate isomerase/epimerase